MCLCESNPYACTTDAGSKCEERGTNEDEHDDSDIHDVGHDQVDLTEDDPEGGYDTFTPDCESYLPEDTEQVSNPNDLPCYNRYTLPF